MIAAPAGSDRCGGSRRIARLAAAAALALLACAGCRSRETKEGKHEAFNAWFVASADTYENPSGHDIFALFYAFRDYRRGSEVKSRLAPFFFHSSDGKGANETWVLPFVGHESDAAGRWWTWAAPLNFFGSEPEEKKSYAYAIPFWWSEERPEKDLKHLWPLYGRVLSGPEGERASAHFLLSSAVRWEFDADRRLRRAWAIPFFGFERGPSSTRLAALGLDGLAAAYSRRSGEDFAAADVLFLGRDREDPNDMAFFSALSWQWGKDSGELAALQAFGGTLSGFHRTWSSHGSSADILSIGSDKARAGIAGYATDANGLSRAGVAPLFQWRREGESTRLAIGGMDPLISLASLNRDGASSEFRLLQAVGIPFFESAHDGTSRWVGALSLHARSGVALFSWRQRTEKEKAAGGDWTSTFTRWHFFPIVFGGREPDLSYDAILPLFVRRRTPDRAYWFTPVAGRMREGKTDVSTWVLPPLFRLETDHSRDFLRWDAPWPIWGYRRDGAEGSSRLSLLPLYLRGRSKALSYDLVLSLFLRRETPDLSYWLTPVAGHVRKDGDRVFDWFLPPVFYREADGKASRWFVLGPLLASSRDDRVGERCTDVLFPLARFSRGDEGRRAHDRIAPFYFRWKDGERETTLAMLLGGRRRDGNRMSEWLLPFYFRSAGEEGSDTFGTAFFRRTRKDSSSLWVFPTAYFSSSKDADYAHVWPFYGYDREGDFERRSVLSYLFFHGTDGKGRSETGILFPLGGATRDGHRSKAWALPVFFRSADAEGSDTFGTIFYRRARKDSSSLWVFPTGYFSSSPGASRAHVWPFFGQDREGDFTRTSFIAPLFFRGSDGKGRSETGVLFPLGGSYARPAEAHTWFVPPLFYRHRKAGDLHWYALWPLLDVETNADGYRKVSSFWYLYRRERTPGQTAFEHRILFGLYHSYEDTKAERSTTSVALLFRIEKTKESRKLYLFTLPFLGIRF